MGWSFLTEQDLLSLNERNKIMPDKFSVGDIVEMKKQHPCGSKQFEVIRLGADIKIKCTGCGRIIMLPRSKFQKDAKKIVNL